jgi:hypothetical protein
MSGPFSQARHVVLGYRSRSREAGMPLYRFYRIGDDGRILSMPEVVDCSGDEDAIEKAKALAVADDIEIWDLARRVAAVAKKS